MNLLFFVHYFNSQNSEILSCDNKDKFHMTEQRFIVRTIIMCHRHFERYKISAVFLLIY
ncbi:MAG: hypothetical protein Q4C96_00650 [Planctomycetia bacterium]|nr:hypothetical protein [Planctomycetia bacterium]